MKSVTDNSAPELTSNQLWCATVIIISCLVSVVVLAFNHINTDVLITTINILVIPVVGLFFQRSNTALVTLVQRQSDVIASLPALGEDHGEA